MTWFTWRQFRTQAWITVAGLAVLGVLLIITGRSIAHAYATTLAGCHGTCDTPIRQFLLQARTGANGRVYNLATGVMYAVPALIGVFWGAPQFAREFENGTHYLAWNQSVSRTRWLATKLAVVGTAAVATAGLLSWAVTSWAQPVDRAAGDRIVPLVYGARGIAPVGWAVFAFVLGVTAGMLIRRTIPAMVTTVVLYVVAVSQMPRPRLVPATHFTRPLDLNDAQIAVNQETGQVWVDIDDAVIPHDAWFLANRTVTPSGKVFTGPADPQQCTGFDSCREWLGTLGLRQDVAYHPANHFWPLQWAEAGIFLALTALLAGFCFWWTRRSSPGRAVR